MSKISDQWWTPKAFFELVEKRYGPFALDAAASYNNRKCDNFLSGPHVRGVACDCGLCSPWVVDVPAGSRVWLNPPFSNLGVWVKKCYEESMRDVSIVQLLLPSVGSRWFADYVWPHAAEIIFLHPRINFDGTEGTNMRDSCLVIWDRFQREELGQQINLWRWKEHE